MVFTVKTNAHTADKITFEELRSKSYGFSNALRFLGAKKGDIVIVCLENCYHYAIIFLGSALIGCSISDELQRVQELTNAKFLILSSRNYHIAVDFIQICQVIILNRQYGQIGNDFDDLINKWQKYNFTESNKIAIDLGDVLLTPFSSGTSGLPKCVQLTHLNFNTSTAILKKALFDKLSGDNCRSTVGILPFYHSSGFWALCYCLLEGHHTVIITHFHLALMLKCIEEYKVDTLNLVPAIIESLCQDDIDVKRWNLSSLKTVLCGSAPLGKELIKRFLRKFPHVQNLIQGYGMTETVVLSHVTPLDRSFNDEDHVGSCGKLLPNFEAKLLDEKTGAILSEAFQVGELLLRSNAIMKGYLNSEEETRKVFDSDNWLHTGDMMYFDSDGYYFIVDRKKDLIKMNGMQVSPSELEDVLKSHENVKDAAVIGIPNADHGQVPKAFVVLVNDEGSEGQLQVLMKYLKDRVAPHKYLRGGIEFVQSLPKLPNGKTSRKDLIHLLSES
ncbi:unnamed protein product [Thelazia callipaeda]|uniref:AMP-binding domain-containing protein n=1 Tax=Thelazia callipaeda TaxID=103827 RepID=A0A158RBH1_THECL|nr:unnamed protein product [Thelazia callipaeda]